MNHAFRIILLPAILALSTAIAACNDNDNDNGEDFVDVDIPQGEMVDDIPQGAPFIDQEDLQFLPDELTVSMGETIYFANSEPTPHTVTINGVNVSGTMEQGDMLAWDPPAPGAYQVTCDFHPQMEATITVTNGE